LTTDWRAKVADLGLSREIVSHKAGHYTVCGTPCWVAPEIFRGENYGWQVDVYSFAVVVWEILAGKRNSSIASCQNPLNVVNLRNCCMCILFLFFAICFLFVAPH
jgi:serine/threonine protein kinase